MPERKRRIPPTEGIVCGMEISMEYISDAQAKQMILEVGRRMYQGGFVAANDGNISCKVGDNEIWATPTGVSKGFMTEDMLVKLDLDGNVLEGTHFQRDQDAPQSIQGEPEGTGRGTCTSSDSDGVCLCGHQSGGAGADGRGSVLGLCAASAFCPARHRGSAGSGGTLLPGIQCCTVSKPWRADLG